MRAGQLRHRLTLKSRSVTPDSYGQDITAATTQATVWGSVEPLSGRELLLAQQVQADVTHRVRIRFHDGVHPKWTVTHDSRDLHVLSVVDVEERGIEMELLCKEAV